MNIALTGGTGFIGAAIVKRIIANGDTPVLLVRADSDLKRVAGLEQVKFIKYEDLSAATVGEALKTYIPEAFIHCAWKGVGGADRNKSFQVSENLPFTMASVELAKKAGCKHWIGMGSQAEYGNQNRKIAEDFPVAPTTIYGKAKLAACWASAGLCDALEMKYSWIRVFSTYGPGDDPAWFIPYIIKELSEGRSPNLTKCEQLWDYLYVDDAANAVLSVVYKEAAGIFNIGTGNTVRLKYVVDVIRQLVNPGIDVNYGAVAYRPDQVMHLEADVSRIFNATGWRSATQLEEGIKNIIGKK